MLVVDDLTPTVVTIFENQNDQYWYMDNVKSFTNTNWLLKINNDHNFVTPTYTDIFDTKAHSLSLYSDLNENFFTVKYGTNYNATSVIEVDDNGLHNGCFETSNYSGSYEIDFNTLTWETRKETYTPPETNTRNIHITSNLRTPSVSPIEIRAPWLCSSHAINIDKTIKVNAGSTVVSHSESEGYYRYSIHTQPEKGSVEIIQPSNFSITGNVIIRYSANVNATGIDTYKLTANDGTGTKIITVTVEIQN